MAGFRVDERFYPQDGYYDDSGVAPSGESVFGNEHSFEPVDQHEANQDAADCDGGRRHEGSICIPGWRWRIKVRARVAERWMWELELLWAATPQLGVDCAPALEVRRALCEVFAAGAAVGEIREEGGGVFQGMAADVRFVETRDGFPRKKVPIAWWRWEDMRRGRRRTWRRSGGFRCCCRPDMLAGIGESISAEAARRRS